MRFSSLRFAYLFSSQPSLSTIICALIQDGTDWRVARPGLQWGGESGGVPPAPGQTTGDTEAAVVLSGQQGEPCRAALSTGLSYSHPVFLQRPHLLWGLPRAGLEAVPSSALPHWSWSLPSGLPGPTQDPAQPEDRELQCSARLAPAISAAITGSSH